MALSWTQVSDLPRDQRPRENILRLVRDNFLVLVEAPFWFPVRNDDTDALITVSTNWTAAGFAVMHRFESLWCPRAAQRLILGVEVRNLGAVANGTFRFALEDANGIAISGAVSDEIVYSGDWDATKRWTFGTSIIRPLRGSHIIPRLEGKTGDSSELSEARTITGLVSYWAQAT